MSTELDHVEEQAGGDADGARFEAAVATGRGLLENIETVVHGKGEQVKLVLAALACRGHVLFEDVPGTAKTVLARAIARSISGTVFHRIQCTPDLQPTDVTGLSVFNQKTREFEFHAGPVFANFLLVDEINRATPKTQSALLEAMAEQQVTVDGTTRELPSPFFLLATENPIEHEGTFPLPEAQLDRFFLKIGLGYPALEQEALIVREQRRSHPLERLRPVTSLDEVRGMQDVTELVYTDEVILRWIVGLVAATRTLDGVVLGASVRASIALESIARAWALLDGRRFVAPSDVERLFLPVLEHRLVLSPGFIAETRQLGGTGVGQRILELCLQAAPRPTLDGSSQVSSISSST
jgi:MoxR-like ATPase